jgi:type II secretory pathway pseudopilin PulG
MKLFPRKKCIKGLTLLETLVSVTIITLVIIGPLSYIVMSSSYARQTKDAMTASFLAEEAIELLQNRYDSLYILCSKQPEVDPCISVTGETVGQIAWRVFKEKLSSGGGYPSCFITDNSSGCSFDYVDMSEPFSSFPSRYTPQDTECPTLVGVSSSTYYSYVCGGVPSHIDGIVSSQVFFKRVVFLEHLPTFELTPRNEQDDDDLRVTSEVRYKSASGATRYAKVVRFIHPRP